MAFDGRGDPPQGAVKTISVTASTTGTATITFSPAYSAVPSLQLTVTGTTVCFPYVTSVSTTGATIGVRRYNDVSSTYTVDVRWDAHI